MSDDLQVLRELATSVYLTARQKQALTKAVQALSVLPKRWSLGSEAVDESTLKGLPLGSLLGEIHRQKMGEGLYGNEASVAKRSSAEYTAADESAHAEEERSQLLGPCGA